MALQECSLNLNRELKELKPHGTIDFPCAGYDCYYVNRPEDAIPWHWHEELEIIFIKEGRLEVKIPSKTFYVEAGDCFAINSNVLHYGMAADECVLQSFVFSPTLIAGNEDSAFAKKYMHPLTSCRAFTHYPILRSEHKELVESFCKAFEAMVEEPFGYELIVRDNLSRICLFLAEEFKDQLDIPNAMQSQDDLRIRKMLEYIHENYANDITLGEIASVADVGERECLRCFQKTIQLSPIQYLLKHRILRGAEMLLQNPDYSVADVAMACGFDSPSNFSKLFKRFYVYTPREYRARYLK